MDCSGHITKMIAMFIYGWKPLTFDLDIWRAALGTQAPQSLYIYDDHELTLTYFRARSNLAAYSLKKWKMLQSHLKEKVAADYQIIREFMFSFDFDPSGLSSSVPALCTYTYHFLQFPQKYW